MLLPVLAIIFTLGLLIACVALLRKHRARTWEYAALSLTPHYGLDLSGRWTIHQETPRGQVLWGGQLTQHGRTVRGWMQCKFAAAHPLEIRGLLVDEQVIATYWRPHPDGIGSGVLTLMIAPDGQSMTGTATWHEGEAREDQCRLRWTRAATGQ